MFDNPKTAYTRELVDAVPHIEPELVIAPICAV
jgi:peptide/nickel transport system ATP-binding protein